MDGNKRVSHNSVTTNVRALVTGTASVRSVCDSAFKKNNVPHQLHNWVTQNCQCVIRKYRWSRREEDGSDSKLVFFKSGLVIPHVNAAINTHRILPPFVLSVLFIVLLLRNSYRKYEALWEECCRKGVSVLSQGLKIREAWEGIDSFQFLSKKMALTVFFLKNSNQMDKMLNKGIKHLILFHFSNQNVQYESLCNNNAQTFQ